MPVGNKVNGEVIRVTDFGAFVEVETGIEGLIHISELSEDRVEKAEDVVKVGDKVDAVVISIDKDAKKIALSLKAAAGGDYKNVKQDEVKSATLGDKFKGLFDNE
jgi:small subunit ribosomal protein S1